jgi:hypothetical protein
MSVFAPSIRATILVGAFQFFFAASALAISTTEDLLGVWVKNVSPQACENGVTFVKEGDKIVNRFKIGDKSYSFEVKISFNDNGVIEVTRSDQFRSLFSIVNHDTLNNFLNADLIKQKSEYIQGENLWYRCPEEDRPQP